MKRLMIIVILIVISGCASQPNRHEMNRSRWGYVPPPPSAERYHRQPLPTVKQRIYTGNDGMSGFSSLEIQ